MGKPLKGHELLTMADQMAAQRLSPKQTVSPTTGAKESPRRQYLKNKIQARAQMWAEKQRKG